MESVHVWKIQSLLLVLLSARLMKSLAQFQPCSEVNYLAQYPNNCFKYLACTTYGYVAMDCPANLAFNVRTQACDYRSFVPGCEDAVLVDACQPNKCVRGSCILNGANSRGYDCLCYSGFTGADCSVDVDECLTMSPCRNSGRCTNNMGGYSCSCLNGYSGPNCEVPPCNSSNCIHGYCNASKVCTCYTGYSGSTCDIVDYPNPNCTQYPCPKDVPAFSYPSWDDQTCRSYYSCSKGSLVKQTCPLGQKFDVVTMQCQSQTEPDRFFCDIFRGPAF